ncbi:DUF4253 domain-containing protein [Kitasatospora sp. MBT63]|uniref:DUF4253 domain-containing protein n=1 Tax=Kitasatospora sp. MBT63 TaxID=1444768 RepID=UPI00068D9B68|nr:DUF4253 domain-containing protein [Kitasatospora sp. MBT63]
MTQPLDLARALAVLPVPLPPGRLVGADADDPEPLLWISDAPAIPGLWAQLHRAHPETGLWPLLLEPLEAGPEFRPWLSGELDPGYASEPDLYDPAALLRTWWEGGGEDDDEGYRDESEHADTLAPYGPAWPGAAPAVVVPDGAADAEARGLADVLQSVKEVRLGLIPARSGAHALAVCGWGGPLNHEGDTGKIAAVLADWERRFGAQVVEVGFDTMQLSVPVPPATLADALPVAAEHTALCPDLVLQGTGTLTAYAEQLVGSHQWSFWWD